MLFVWLGFLKDGADPVPQSVQQQTIDFLQQPYINIRSVGPLRDDAGKRAAMMMIFDAADRSAAEAFDGIDPSEIEITRRVLARARENACRNNALNRASNQ